MSPETPSGGQATPTLAPLLDDAPCGFLTFSDDGTVEIVNRTLLDLLGYERQEVVGGHVERLMPVGSRIFYQTHWFPLLRLTGEAEEIFLLLRGKDGEDVGMLVNSVARRSDRGSSYDCVFMRVRERRKYEDELLRARRVAEQARAEVEARAAELRKANELLEAQAVELEMQQQQLQDQAVALEETSEELRTMVEHLTDRTEEAEHLRKVADEANRAKSTFLAVMSHELRTPLNAIAGYVQLMEMGIHGPVTEAQLEALSRVSRSQQHLLGLINDVLDLSRIEAGRVAYAIEESSVYEIVGSVTPMIEPQLQEKGLSLEIDVPAELRVRVDAEKAQQILLNLLGNAVKFTPSPGSIRIEARASDGGADEVWILIRDTGMGIPAEKLASVFEPFVQVKESRSRDEGPRGSGLGLAISRDLARGMKGDLTAESELGRGSTFRLALPRA